MRRSPLHLAVVAALSIPVLLLSACGGGGGGSAPTASTSTSSNPTPSAPASQPTAPASAFPTAAVLQQQAYGRIQQLQQAMGLNFAPNLPNPPGINPVFETTAKNHLNYMFTNTVFTASEDMSLPGSTGKTFYLQAVAAGLPADNDTDGGEMAAIPPGVTGAQWIDALLSTGTGATFLLPCAQFGFAFAPWPNASAPTAMGGMVAAGGWYNQLDLATGTSTRLYFYPYNGQTDVPPTNLVTDYPGSGLPFFGGTPAGSYGTPISFLVGANDYVSIQSAVLKDAQGTVLPVTTYSATVDPQTGLSNGATAPGWNGGRALVRPNAPLQPNTAYTLTWTVQYGPMSVPQGQIPMSFIKSGTLTFTTGDQKPFNPQRLF